MALRTTYIKISN